MKFYNLGHKTFETDFSNMNRMIMTASAAKVRSICDISHHSQNRFQCLY